MTCVYTGPELADYHFGADHPFGPQRHAAFYDEFTRTGLDNRTTHRHPVKSDIRQMALFHTQEYLDQLVKASESGQGYLDHGDTPARKGIFDAAAFVVGSVLDAVDQIMSGNCINAFIPIAGLHHARRNTAAGFCVVNDCGIAIGYLRKQYSIKRILYVDIDAHHGDGVFYSFESDPNLPIVDFHEDGRFLYPGTGFREETGKGPAKDTKLNVPLPMEADDELFRSHWPEAEELIIKSRPEFILFQCGADSLAGDPITHLRLSEKSHAFVAQRLVSLAGKYCDNRLLAMGGGGYNHDNIASAWNAVVAELIKAS